MTDDDTFDTLDILRRFGFEDGISDTSGLKVLSYSFSSFTLEALPCMGKWLRPVVLFTGIVSTPRTLGLIEFELLPHLASAEQGAALLAYYLRHYAQDEADWWLELGRDLQDQLPWRIQRAKEAAIEAARPKCSVERDWMKLAIRAMRAELPLLPFDAPVVFSFVEPALTIKWPGRVLAIPATGNTWPDEVCVNASELCGFPKRIMDSNPSVRVGDSSLSFCGKSFKILAEVSSVSV